MSDPITIEQAREVVAQHGGVLRWGKGNKGCAICTRQVRALLLGMGYSDSPDGAGPTDRACQRLNDASWSSDEARTEACLPLVLLAEADAAEGWVEQYVIRTVREILPITLDAVGVDSQACRDATDIESARKAAAAADAAASDEVLTKSVRIMIECHKGQSK